MAYENLCMYCFQDLKGESICPHCGKDARAAVPQIQMLPGSLVYRDRFLVGRALGQDSSGIVYTALDTRRGGVIRIREYLPRNCAERLNDGSVVPVPGMEDAFDAGMKKLRASVESVDDPRKRHFYFEENGTAYIAQRKNGAAAAREDAPDDDMDEAEHRKRIALYICIAVAVVLVIALGLVLFLNSMSEPEDVTLDNPLSTLPSDSTWMPLTTPTPTPYATATFAALVDPELSWMDYTYNGNVDQEYNQQQSAQPTKMPTIIDDESYDTVSGSSSNSEVTKLQQHLVKLGWLSSANVTGKYDAATKQAVKDFQTYVNEHCSPAKKLSVDGIAGQKTLQWLYNSSVSLVKPTPTPRPLVTAAPDKSVINASSPKSVIRGLQRQLITLGLLPKGSADGIFGSSTTTAVRNFQIRVNQLQGYAALSVDGVVDELTQSYLDYYVDWWLDQQAATPTPRPTNTSTPRPTNTPLPMNTPASSGTINASSSRREITEMQELLEKVGLLKSSGVDGKYGSGTIAAVKNFQKFVNRNTGADTLAITGECDLLTQQYLRYCVEHGIRVDSATEAPTNAPTATPTSAPTEAPTVPPEEDPDYSEGNIVVDADSPRESIQYVQEMLSNLGLLGTSDVDGKYGNKTINAVILFQQWVNEEKGSAVLEVSGVCDALTLQYLEYCSDRGFSIGDANATPVPTEAPTEVPTEAPTEVPTEAPTEAPHVGAIESFRVQVNGFENDGSLIEAPDSGKFTIRWGAVGEVESYSIYLYAEDGTLINSTDGSHQTEMTVNSRDMTPGSIYTLKLGAMPSGGTQDDMVWQTVQLIRPVAATAEPTAEPTEAPSVGTPVLNIGSSVYQENGVTYVSGDKIIFSWMADGDVDHYIATLRYEDGTDYSLGSTHDTSKSVDTNYLRELKPAGMWRLEIGAVAVGAGDADAVWNTLTFGVPDIAAPEETDAPFVPDEPDAPADPGSEKILYIDASSASEDIKKVQIALYGYNLINIDNLHEGELDAATLEAVASFQQRVNERYGADLYVIDPETDAFIDEMTLDLLLYQKPDLD